MDATSPSARSLGATSLRERQKEKRRARIYSAAISLFREGGFQATTASDIAQASNVSRGTFFNYYPYKEAVLLDYGADLVARLHSLARERLTAGHAPLAVLREVWEALAAENTRDRDLIPPLAYEVMNPDPQRARLAYEALPLSRVVEDILSPLAQAGELRSDLSLRRMCNLIADTYLLTALRWSAYGSERSLREELLLNLDFTLGGVLRRGR